MATQAWSTPIEHSSDATFRTWGQEFHDKLAAVGTITQAADTGQINWTTVTRPGTNTNAGYEIWYLNDAMHSTAPIYIRFDFGTAGGTARPRIQATVGTGTNGAGTITGTATSAVTWTGNSDGAAATNRDSYLCCKAGFFGIMWKVAASGSPPSGQFIVNRTCDADGTPNGHGAKIIWRSNNANYPTHQCLRFATTAAARTSSGGTNPTYDAVMPWTFINGGATTVGSDYQVTLVVGDFPEMYPMFGLVAYKASEIALGTTFSATTVGSTSRTYIGNTANNMGNTGWHIPSVLTLQAMLYE